MKNAVIYFTSLFLCGLICISCPSDLRAESNAKTLFECYKLALKQSETLAIAEESIEEAEGRFGQALSTILPRINYEHSYEWQDVSERDRRETPEGKFVFSQPLFRGFREFAAIAAGRYDREQQQQLRNRAKQILFLNVTDAFYLFLDYREDLDVLSEVHQALTERSDELEKREKLGRSRPSEVASAQARLSQIEAEIESVKSEQYVARQLLEFLTGTSVEDLIDDQNVNAAMLPPAMPVERAGDRADVLAAELSYKKAQKEIAVARAELFPEINFDSNYYTKRVGSSEGNDWDVTLSIDVPLYEGGVTFGKIKEAEAIANQEELQYQKTKREAKLDIENTYTRFEFSLRRFEALRKALAATQKNYDLQVEDFRMSLVNNLEVLQALEELQDIKRDYVRVRNETKRLYWKYCVAIGVLPDDTI